MNFDRLRATTDLDSFSMPFVLIFGSGRSGTTLVREILNQHSSINILPETGFYDRHWAGRQWLGSPRCRDGWIRWLYYVLFESYDPAMKQYVQYWPRLLDEFSKRPPRNPDDMFHRLTSVLGECKGKSIVGEKTPRHLMYWRRLHRCVAGARSIITIRDPRAVVASMLKRGDLAKSAWRAAVEWRLAAEIADQVIEEAEGKSLLVRYEDLVCDSHRVIQVLCGFLGIEFEPKMEVGVGSNSSYSLSEKAGIVSDSLDRWQVALTGKQIEQVERICGPRMKRYGYAISESCTHDRLSVREWMHLRRLRLEPVLGHLGVRPSRAYLRHLRCRLSW